MRYQEIREVPIEFKDTYNQLVSHPLQSWEWGEFREKIGVKIVRRGIFQSAMPAGRHGELIDGFQLTIHKIPHTPWTVGYFPRGREHDETILSELVSIAKKTSVSLLN